ncbi:MAG: Uma2 family endonuclease [Cyanobacteria bacterium SBLK]|nr:Uma2 family endonuclease [Cyanobacteria bacterium SBLK]
MIAFPQRTPYLTPEEYLKFEEESAIKHEYIDGEVYAMAGASDPHVTISLNLASQLLGHLRDRGCRVYISDMKAQIESKNRFYYPDVMVTCDLRDRETPKSKRFPCLIVEVLSPSTEAFDRGDKFADYQTLESLQEYVLINMSRHRVECFRRGDNGLWILQSYAGENSNFQLKSIDFEGTMVSLYEEVIFETVTEQNSDPQQN